MPKRKNGKAGIPCREPPFAIASNANARLLNPIPKATSKAPTWNARAPDRGGRIVASDVTTR